ncbi:hypothetical protein HUG10_05695 [Halorarum halophilum]|uniref:Uncharacterized protein n=1 Tax=Halorarum halophilum TaxID=2743090 RepID=A0A7D5GK72_9EURY|nr:hypothetical protein [Halobaculum halophilum]QLG27067.1 hypothetical protein HUG10_05695 [Halobaculum halophilum]
MTERTMKDVSHTPPNDVSAADVWKRGGEEGPSIDSEAEGSSPAPADD